MKKTRDTDMPATPWLRTTALRSQIEFEHKQVR